MTQDKYYYLYKLFYEEEPNVVYIGQTNNIEKRFKLHQLPSQLKKRNLKNNWIKRRNAKGWKLKYCIIDVAETREILVQREKDCIAFYKTLEKDGFATLKNSTDGGEGVVGYKHKFTKKNRKNMRKAQLGKTVSAETREKMSAAKKGQVMSPEARAKMSVARKREQEIIRKIKSGEIKKKTRIYKSSFKLISPEGELVTGKNVHKFCESLGLHPSGMYAVLSGKRKSCGGYTSTKPYKKSKSASKVPTPKRRGSKTLYHTHILLNESFMKI